MTQLKDIVTALKNSGNVNDNGVEENHWIDLHTRAVFFAFHSVNLAENVFTTYKIGFEIHASGLVKPIFKTKSHVDNKLVLN